MGSAYSFCRELSQTFQRITRKVQKKKEEAIQAIQGNEFGINIAFKQEKKGES